MTQNLPHDKHATPNMLSFPLGFVRCKDRKMPACRSIGVFDKKDTDDSAKHEREEEEHAEGIAKHDVFGMSVKAKDVGNEGDVRALDTNMKV